MFPTRLNLLPPDNQKYLQKLVFTQFIKNTLETMLLFICIAAVALLSGQRILQNYFNGLTENVVAISEENSQSNKQIKEINISLQQTQQIQEEYILWTPLFSQLTTVIPPGVTFSSVVMNMDEKQFVFAGEAQTREDLLELEQKLESLLFISSINIPLSQLTDKENILFTVSAQIADL